MGGRGGGLWFGLGLDLGGIVVVVGGMKGGRGMEGIGRGKMWDLVGVDDTCWGREYFEFTVVAYIGFGLV